jgi:hypothetical protein
MPANLGGLSSLAKLLHVAFIIKQQPMYFAIIDWNMSGYNAQGMGTAAQYAGRELCPRPLSQLATYE